MKTQLRDIYCEGYYRHCPLHRTYSHSKQVPSLFCSSSKPFTIESCIVRSCEKDGVIDMGTTVRGKK